MKIEEELKVRQFKSEWHKVTVNLVFTANKLTEILEKRAEKQQITLQQFNALRILRGQYPNPATNNLLKSRLLTNTPDISRLMDRLVAKDLISRCKSSGDKRSVDLLITDKGLQVLEELEEVMLLNDILPKNFKEKDCEKLSDLLDKLRGSLCSGEE
ncbi:MarR family winged helix-turn-helix transcriptional regulator [Sphingobacterium spiritivorum]|uniref:Transcriptional regulator, MarR family n=3 Tax=Sphingobacterium spiritivorum TaxID=258 RepID=D7VKF8_SPHSI|nr:MULTISPECIES: MarR family transcriptional regulator [Sphingobacterium]EEI89581.1 transcriptional regulator, MarR family [Sphingobacterium spiritivorum ATCC 33300]EFK58760.1 transcriptional regulator, MarR family [Sphingobacterium spiritivorum ATCC 33861]QQS94664.1 MarR family transcriptional regulator [Sphingobacterium spiritivorum]QQT24665.1 MarR family transcriptional regulator [Sphingobacterium spiritivorum]QQT34355.1 MarR family transcriptional regulator [Sphingobacterium spiritivorum]